MRFAAILLVFVVLVGLLSPSVVLRGQDTEKEPKKHEETVTENKHKEPVIRVREIEPFTYCALEMTGSYDQHAAAFQTLYGEAGKQALEMSAVPFGIYWNDPEETPPEKLLWEIGFPVSADQKIEEPLKIKRWEYTLVVSKRYEGSFAEEHMKALHAEMGEWIEKNGYAAAGPCMEKYLSMPVPDESGELTGSIEVLVPVQGKKE